MNKNKLLVFFIINGLFNLAANYAHPITPTVIKNLELGDYMFGVAYLSAHSDNFKSGGGCNLLNIRRNNSFVLSLIFFIFSFLGKIKRTN